MILDRERTQQPKTLNCETNPPQGDSTKGEEPQESVEVEALAGDIEGRKGAQLWGARC